MIKWLAFPAFALLAAQPAASWAQTASCGIPAVTVAAIQNKLATVTALPDANGGIFKPNRMLVGHRRPAGQVVLGHQQRQRSVAGQPVDCHCKGEHRQRFQQ